ncbi:MAG: hypothetical protein U0R19_00095 [Bryobacteraceae bacterium]
MRTALLVALWAARLALGDQVQLAHPANPSFANAGNSPTPLAVGMRVLVTTATRQCIAAEGWSLRLYPLGALEGFEARILGARELDGCVRELDAVLPEELPLGVMEAVLTDGEGRAMAPYAVRIMPVQFALLHDATRAVAGRVVGGRTVPLTLTAPARVGTRVMVRGAGLGRARAEEVMIRVGEARVRPLVVRPVNGEPGLEEIEFEIPRNVGMYGCYVPLGAEVRGVQRNVTSIPVAEDAGACRHSLGLTEAQLRLLDGGGRIPVVELWLSRNYALPGRDYFEVSLVQSGMAGAALMASNTGMDRAPLQAGCQVNNFGDSGGGAMYGGRVDSVEPLRLGELELTSPDGQKESVPHTAVGSGGVGIFGRVGDARYAVGEWQFRASGGDVEVNWRVRMAPDVRPVDLDLGAILRANEAREVRWNGADYEDGDWMMFRLNRAGSRGELVCAAPARDGRMMVALDEFQKIPIEDAAMRGFGVSMWVRREAAAVFRIRMRDGLEGVGIYGGVGVGSLWGEEP